MQNLQENPKTYKTKLHNTYSHNNCHYFLSDRILFQWATPEIAINVFKT